VASRSKAWACGLSLAGIAGSKPNEGMDICLCDCMRCQVEVSMSGLSLVQRSPTEFGVSNIVRSQSPVRKGHNAESSQSATIKKRKKIRQKRSYVTLGGENAQ
jgi:hypothetical protein